MRSAASVTLYLLGTSLIVSATFLVALSPTPSVADTPSQIIPVSSEPDHKIRFDNGRVRMYEVILPKGKTSQVHEHRADSFSVVFRDTEVTIEPLGQPSSVFQVRAGFVSYSPTTGGPYSHRVMASGDAPLHVIAMELLSPTPSGPASANQRADSRFRVTLENARGRVYRVFLPPGESTGTYVRSAGSALFAISAGRIKETPETGPARLWDFEPGHYRWFDTGEKLSLKNESSTPIDLVAIEIF